MDKFEKRLKNWLESIVNMAEERISSAKPKADVEELVYWERVLRAVYQAQRKIAAEDFT